MSENKPFDINRNLLAEKCRTVLVFELIKLKGVFNEKFNQTCKTCGAGPYVQKKDLIKHVRSHIHRKDEYLRDITNLADDLSKLRI